MLEFYRLQQLANQRGLLRDKYRYRALSEPPTPKVEGSRDLSLPGPRTKHVSRRAFQFRLPAAKYGIFPEKHWYNDLEARSEDRIETEPPKEQPLPLISEELPTENADANQHTISVTDVADNTFSEQPEDKECVDADADLPELDLNPPDPYAILLDDQFALIQPEAVKHLEVKRLLPPTHLPPLEPARPTEIAENTTHQP